MAFAWAKNKSELIMPTAYTMQDEHRQALERNRRVEYLDPAPKDRDLIEARIVLPGDYMLPDGLNNPHAFDDVCQQHHVWVSLLRENVIIIQAEYIKQLRDATKAVNWMIHNLRLATEKFEGCYVVQSPTQVLPEALISLRINERPRTIDPASQEWQLAVAVKAFQTSLTSKLSSSAEAMKTLNDHMHMRVNFGHILLRQKPKDVGEELSYPEYQKFMKNLSRRETATIRSKIPNINHAETMVKMLTDESHNPDVDVEDVQHESLLILKTANGDAIVRIPKIDKRETPLARPDFEKTDSAPRLNMVFTAPDMSFDWSLRVDLVALNLPVPTEVSNILRHVKLFRSSDMGSSHSFEVPNFSLYGAFSQPDHIKGVEIKHSITVPFGMTPYVVKVSVVRSWVELKSPKSSLDWSVELYGRQWDAALNHVNAGERKKDWGDKMQSVWPGCDDSLRGRLGEFFECVLKVQGMLEQLK